MAGRKYHPLAGVLKAAVILLATREIHSYPHQWDDLPGRPYSGDDASYYDDDSTSDMMTQVRDTMDASGSLPDIYEHERPVQRRTVPMSKTGNEAVGFVFPDHQKTSSRLQKTGDVRPPPNCRGLTFCEEVPDYPEDLVNKAIQKDSSLNNCANIDVVNLPQRIDINDEAPLCLSTEQIVFPKAAETINKEWMYVVNTANFTQGVRIELCAEENSRCKMIDGFAEGYVTVCKQRYIYRQLAAITETNGMAPELFRLPSSCCCHVRFTGNAREEFLSRIGVNRGMETQNMTPAVVGKSKKL